MSKRMGNDRKRLVPKLRFPEFWDKGEWNLEELEKVCDINPPNSGLPDSFVYIDLESVEAGELIQKKLVDRENAPSRAQRTLKDGDVIYQVVRPYQKNNFFCSFKDESNYVASTGYAQFRAYDSKSFLYQAIHTDDFVARVLANCTGSNYPAINSSSLAKITIAVPGPKEQQKIADCLSSLDKLITAHSDKLGALKAHKKGLMQQIFPREGETVPRLRFPEFRDSGGWEIEELEKLADRITHKKQCGEQIRVLTNSAEYGVVDQRDYFDKDIANKNNLDGYFIAEKDDYVYNPRVSTIAPVGPISKNKVGRGVMSPLYTVFRFKAINSGFYEQYFKSTHWHQYLRQVSNTGARHDRMSIANDDLMAMPLPNPCPKEQQKIADCLSSLDELIAAYSDKLDTLKAHKKGLMQQLFPVVDEIGA